MQQRLAALPDQLRSLDCEVVLLQEVYGHSSRHWLAEAVRDAYPYAIYPRRRRRFGLENGLMTLSRYPAQGELELFTAAAPDREVLR